MNQVGSEIYENSDILGDRVAGARPIAPGLPPGAAERLAHNLQEAAPRLVREFAQQTGYVLADAQALWHAAEEFVAGFRELEKGRRERLALLNQRYSGLNPRALLQDQPYGRVLVTIPSNAAVPLAVIVPLAFAAAGNVVIVAAAGPTRAVALQLAQLVAAAVPHNPMFLWGGRVRDAIAALVDGGLADLLYYMGSSTAYAEIAARCAASGVELIYEGEGNSVAIVDATLDDAGVANAVTAVFRSKLFGFGRMCSAPNALAVEKTIASRFLAAYGRLCQAEPLPRPLRELVASSSWNEIQEALRCGCVTVPSLPAAQEAFLITGVDLDQAASHELFCPVAYFTEYDDTQAMLMELSKLRHRLQVSLFTRDTELASQLVSMTHFARYCINITPVDQDPLLPWGNRGRSGDSPVEDFASKAVRTVIIEGAPFGSRGC